MESAHRCELWPEFARACLERGILSTLSLPLTHRDARLGAMNMYARAEMPWDDETVEFASLFAEQASIVLANAQAYWNARTLSDQLTESMQSRAVIEQAKGIIMGSMRCTAEQAFEHLQRQSQHTNTKLRDVAQSIVSGVSRS
jgi:GAF domain-containing protein